MLCGCDRCDTAGLWFRHETFRSCDPECAAWKSTKQQLATRCHWMGRSRDLLAGEVFAAFHAGPAASLPIAGVICAGQLLF